MRSIFRLIPLFSLLCLAAEPASQPASYHSDFSRVEVSKLPADLLVLNGEFSVREVEGRKMLELAAGPLETFGVLFGPADSASVEVSARIWGEATGKRSPEFGIGSGDSGGFKLWLMPATSLIELRKGDDTRATAAYAWTSGAWTLLKLRVAKSGATWRIEGKAWPETAKEPAEWLLHFDDAEAPAPGRASIWGEPFSEKPIRFDALSVTTAK